MSIVIVSGLPRSGTSMMMQMLHAGGVPVLVDEHRRPDVDNPLGYYEYEPVKSLLMDNSWMHEAEGKAVKVVYALLGRLPREFDYKIVMMKRPIAEVIASQKKMLERSGKRGAANDQVLRDVFMKQLEKTAQLIRSSRNMNVMEVEYHRGIREPRETALSVADFVGMDLDIEKMISIVEPTLHRQRSNQPGDS